MTVDSLTTISRADPERFGVEESCAICSTARNLVKAHWPTSTPIVSGGWNRLQFNAENCVCLGRRIC